MPRDVASNMALTEPKMVKCMYVVVLCAQTEHARGRQQKHCFSFGYPPYTRGRSLGLCSPLMFVQSVCVTLNLARRARPTQPKP